MERRKPLFSYMWKIGNIEINSRVVLAPMAGYTSSGYRKFMNPFGVGVCVTEMVSDMGLIFENDVTESYVKYEKDGVITGVQLFGSNPENMAKAASLCLKINPYIDFFDVNMGCPVPKVTKSGSGSALMENPKLCGEIIKAIKQATGLPVSAKIRLGYSKMTYKEVIKELEIAGVDMIAIHPRTRKELYSGTPHYELVKNLRDEMHVPLVVSGNIYTLDDAINAIDITHADAVMVARGGVGNPFLIKQIDEYYKTGNRLPSPSLKEQIEYCYQLFNFIIEEKGEIQGSKVFRAMGPKFFSGFPNSKEVRGKIASETNDKASLITILRDYAKEQNIEINFDY